MAKVNESYETMVVFSMTDGEDAVKALAEKFKNMIAAAGTVESVDEWGKRKLAYLINDEAEGYYVLFNLECEPAFPAEFQRIAGITDGVLRSIVVKK